MPETSPSTAPEETSPEETAPEATLEENKTVVAEESDHQEQQEQQPPPPPPLQHVSGFPRKTGGFHPSRLDSISPRSVMDSRSPGRSLSRHLSHLAEPKQFRFSQASRNNGVGNFLNLPDEGSDFGSDISGGETPYSSAEHKHHLTTPFAVLPKSLEERSEHLTRMKSQLRDQDASIRAAVNSSKRKRRAQTDRDRILNLALLNKPPSKRYQAPGEISTRAIANQGRRENPASWTGGAFTVRKPSTERVAESSRNPYTDRPGSFAKQGGSHAEAKLQARADRRAASRAARNASKVAAATKARSARTRRYHHKGADLEPAPVLRCHLDGGRVVVKKRRRPQTERGTASARRRSFQLGMNYAAFHVPKLERVPHPPPREGDGTQQQGASLLEEKGGKDTEEKKDASSHQDDASDVRAALRDAVALSQATLPPAPTDTVSHIQTSPAWVSLLQGGSATDTASVAWLSRAAAVRLTELEQEIAALESELAVLIVATHQPPAQAELGGADGEDTASQSDAVGRGRDQFQTLSKLSAERAELGRDVASLLQLANNAAVDALMGSHNASMKAYYVTPSPSFSLVGLVWIHIHT
jgi:hypothetical protein